MAEIVNLKRARKAKARRGKEAEAAARRLAFGEPGAAAKHRRAIEKLQSQRLEGHRLTEAEKDEQ